MVGFGAGNSLFKKANAISGLIRVFTLKRSSTNLSSFADYSAADSQQVQRLTDEDEGHVTAGRLHAYFVFAASTKR